MNSGWLRLWIVISALIILGVSSVLAYEIWGRDSCYTFISVTIDEKSSPDDIELAESVRSEATSKRVCGNWRTSNLLTMEGLASRGVITQVGLSWLEPSGWAFENGMIGVIDGKEITAEEIINLVNSYVHKSRLKASYWILLSAIGFCLLALALGFAFSWIYKGFRNSNGK
jgi:hypothetical protein